jgi:hypothetical protein
MSEVNVYSELPVFSRFVAIDTAFKGVQTFSEGIKNPAINLSQTDHEVVESINVLRSKFTLARRFADYSLEVYGDFWVYKVAPTPSLIFMNGYERFEIDNHPLSPPPELNISNWDVYQHYSSLHPGISLATNGSTSFGGTILDDYIFSNQLNYSQYLTGVWNWDWSWYQISTNSAPSSDPSDSTLYNYLCTYQMISIPTVVRVKNPNYIHLLSGFPGDSRTIENNIIVIPTVSEQIEIEYYSINNLESIPDLSTIDVFHRTVDLIANVPCVLPIKNCVLGTLSLSSATAKARLISTFESNGKYPYKYFFGEYLEELFIVWGRNMSNPPLNTIRILGANNNPWNNKPVPTNDQNFDITHPMFAIDNQRAYDWHIKPQSNGSYGNLVMDSPRMIEIHAALNASQYLLEVPAIVGTGTIDNPQTPATHKLDWYIKNSAGEKVTAIWKALGGNKYGINSIDNTKDRVTNLGFLVERIAKVLGIRFDDNGKIEVEKEKATVRKVIDGTKNVDPEKVGVNGFGEGGMVVKRINNRFKQKGEIVSDQCVVLQDIPDLIQEYFEQSNLALGIQESSAIEIKQGTTSARFNSQLELLIELVNLMSSSNEMTRAALVSSLVTQNQTNELIAGLGLPSVTKTIPVKIDKKVTQLPFKGIAAHRSISQEIATCTYNVGIATGQLL